ncbi:survival of motor neuron protein-like [Antedon mediterranea]|uniref:survival of motor neuron protein-like n=1 Tax=Antedon mediterranea TaxID=105859 RepID=UPI003AF89584
MTMQDADFMFRVDSQQITGSNENIWDDTALIKAYDKAVESVKKDLGNGEVENAEQPVINKQKRRRKGKKKKKPKWNVGDHCQALYAVDDIYYEAVINSVNVEQGSCWVTFEEYGNEEEVELRTLKHSCLKNKHTKHVDISETETGSAMEYSDYMYNSPSHPMEHPGCRGAWNPNPWMVPPMCPPFMPPFAMSPMAPPYASPMPYYQRTSGFPNWPPAPPAPPPVRPPNMESDDSDDGLHSMLIAWYMSGYHTGYYQGLKDKAKSPAPKQRSQKGQGRHHSQTPTHCKAPSLTTESP